MRLIDADALISKITILADYEYDDKRREAFKQCLDYFHSAPTAYDVEKVLSEIEYNHNIDVVAMEQIHEENKYLELAKKEYCKGRRDAYRVSMKLVRKGGVNECNTI